MQDVYCFHCLSSERRLSNKRQKLFSLRRTEISLFSILAIFITDRWMYLYIMFFNIRSDGTSERKKGIWLFRCAYAVYTTSLIFTWTRPSSSLRCSRHETAVDYRWMRPAVGSWGADKKAGLSWERSAVLMLCDKVEPQSKEQGKLRVSLYSPYVRFRFFLLLMKCPKFFLWQLFLWSHTGRKKGQNEN